MAKIQGFRRLGPLTPLVGTWEGNTGEDVSFRHQHEKIISTSYFERFSFAPIPVQNNGDQVLEGLKYTNQAWRHGEETMDPFHDEVGYLLWDEVRGQVLRAVCFGRGISILAGGDAEAYSTVLPFRSEVGDPNYGILQNKYLSERAQLVRFESIFTFDDEDTFHYDQTLVLKMTEFNGATMDHVDTNTLHRVG